MLKVFIGVILFIVLCVGVYFFNIITWKNEVNNYSGDGIIRTLDTGGVFKGYEIAFEKISLNNDYIKKYTLSNLPEIKTSKILTFRVFCGCSNLDELEKLIKLFKDVKIGLMVNSNNTEIVSLNSKLKNWRYTYQDELDFIDFYYINNDASSIISYESNWDKDVTINLLYSPIGNAEQLLSFKGQLVLRAGGRK